jgi:hypothetical protein
LASTWHQTATLDPGRVVQISSIGFDGNFWAMAGTLQARAKATTPNVLIIRDMSLLLHSQCGTDRRLLFS